MRTQNLALKNTVTDRDVEHILSLRRTFEAQKRRLEIAETALTEAEGNVIARIESGAAVVSAHTVALRNTERRNVQWKSHFAAIVGAEAAEAVLAATVPSITVKLLVE